MQPEAMAAKLAVRHSPHIPPVRPPSGPVPADTRRGWALQALATAERGARNGDLLTASTLRALAARQSAMAARPVAEMAVSL